MIRSVRFVLIVAGLVTVPALESRAQMQTWEDRGFVNVNIAGQPTSRDFEVGGEFDRFGETGSFETPYQVDGSGVFDIGGGVRVWRNLAFGIAFSRQSDTHDAAFSALVPHPVFFDRPRAVNPNAITVEHSEASMHLQALWFIPIDPRFDIAVFAGPTFIRAKQEILTDPDFVRVDDVPALAFEAPPFTDVTVTGLAVRGLNETAVGFNVGGDITYRIRDRIGVGLLIRWAGATIDIPTGGGQTVELDVGGFQAGGGLRLRF